MAQPSLFQRLDDQRIEGRQLPRLRQGRPERQRHSLSAAARFRSERDELVIVPNGVIGTFAANLQSTFRPVIH